MEARALATLLAITAAVAGAVRLTAPDVGDDLRAQATAAALEAQMAWLFTDPEGRSHARDNTMPRVALCVASEVPLDFAALAQALAGSGLRPVPSAQCDENGDVASALTVVGVRCPTSARCLVDIDGDLEGGSYEVRRSAGGWAVTANSIRWIA
ncbi:MAG: hypothetical protein NBV68_04965 [Erythrobacter sp.]|uniref:hypothetical protein n=1 Tax=Erythrobacter sp. TaxID=1042 RepID=UPI0025CEB1D0|nr:hypothetical protein [Erythrobacter sp.]MCL9998708.1 hypothetical protein [Erythrobacter sp.]